MMRTTFRLFSAACLLTATLGCQPETQPDVSTDMDIQLGEPDTFVDSNTTAVGELPDSNITGTAEVPEVTETPKPIETEVTEPAASETPDVEETPAVSEVPATEPLELEQEPAEAIDEEIPETLNDPN